MNFEELEQLAGEDHKATQAPITEDRKDIIESLKFPDGVEVYLMHNEALAIPYYLATNGLIETERIQRKEAS